MAWHVRCWWNHKPIPRADDKPTTVCARCGNLCGNPPYDKRFNEAWDRQIEADRLARLAAREAGDPDWMEAKAPKP